MLAAEHRQGELARSLKLSFGGGYELAIWNDGKFVLIGGYTTTVWNASVNAGGVRISMPPSLIANVYYQDEYLVIVSNRLTRQSDQSIQHKAYTFIISPFASTAATFSPAPPPRFEYHAYALDLQRNHDSVHSIGAMVEFSGLIANSRARLVDVDDGRKAFEVSPEFQAELVGYIQKMTKS